MNEFSGVVVATQRVADVASRLEPEFILHIHTRCSLLTGKLALIAVVELSTQTSARGGYE
jgi:hypothetical protein